MTLNARLCAEFGISRKTGYKIFDRYKDCEVQAFSDRSHRAHRQANRLPAPNEATIVRLKREYRDWGAPKIRVPVAALFHGQVINIAGLARDAATARTTVEGYLGILQDMLVATLLPAFEAKLRVRERQHPKLYWVDPGLARAAKQQLGPVAAEERGPLLEGLVLTILRAHNGDSELFEEVSCWAPAQARQTEVDFLLRRGREFLAVEVKAQPRFSTPQLAGLRAIGELPRLARRILVYLGERQLRTEDGIDVWPFDRFTAAAADGSLWP